MNFCRPKSVIGILTDGVMFDREHEETFYSRVYFANSCSLDQYSFIVYSYKPNI